MAIQTIELSGQRYVILPEREFLELRARRPTEVPAESSAVSSPAPHAGGGAKFREVVPLRVGGVAASELLMRDRR